MDGLRVLSRMGAHFYPGRVRAIEPPFIFAVSLDSERGNRPHIFAKEEVLTKIIIEVSRLAAVGRYCARTYRTLPSHDITVHEPK